MMSKTDAKRPHLIDGEFQSDKYPTTPRGKVPLSVKDPTAQDLLWVYAERRRKVDAEFADDLRTALLRASFEPENVPPSREWSRHRIDVLETLLDAALARAEAAERERDEARAQAGHGEGRAVQGAR